MFVIEQSFAGFVPGNQVVIVLVWIKVLRVSSICFILLLVFSLWIPIVLALDLSVPLLRVKHNDVVPL